MRLEACGDEQRVELEEYKRGEKVRRFLLKDLS